MIRVSKIDAKLILLTTSHRCQPVRFEPQRVSVKEYSGREPRVLATRWFQACPKGFSNPGGWNG